MAPLRPRHHRHLALGLAACLVLLALSLWITPSLASWQSDPPPVTGPGSEFAPVRGGVLPTSAPVLSAARAPLTIAERGYAISLARAALPSDATDVLGEGGGEVLSADLPALDRAGGPRLVSVLIYDYTRQQTAQVTVNLTHRDVEDLRSVSGLQPPPSLAETAQALRIALHDTYQPRFLAEYRHLTGGRLLAPEQVEATGGVYRSAAPQAVRARPAAGPCESHRCLRLLIALPGGPYLSTGDFAVDLSSRRLVPVGGVGHEHE